MNYRPVECSDRLPDKRPEKNIVVSEYVYVEYEPNIWGDIKYGRSRYNHKFGYWGNNDDKPIPSEAEPDTTQQQIMKVMNGASFDYSRVLNLSDLRTSDSNKLYKFLKSDEAESVDHSIFSTNREKELSQLFIKKVPVIFGWGVNPVLIPLATQAV